MTKLTTFRVGAEWGHGLVFSHGPLAPLVPPPIHRVAEELLKSKRVSTGRLAYGYYYFTIGVYYLCNETDPSGRSTD